ncbi:MAG: stage II sporulation protein R [Clostridia bacterium]|nr:stage II sporulation protein R [Clostridia bacterium]
MNDRRFTKAMLSLCAGFLITAVLSSLIPASGEEKLYTDVIRLHVIAESDSEEDQAVKLSVRDAVLDLVSSEMDTAATYDDAYALLSQMIPEIKAIAEETAAKEGHPLTAEVVFDREEYPVRYYEDYALPAGEYMSMRIILGEGEGRNWWCVLFPPLCRDAAVDSHEDEFYAAGFTPEEYKIIKQESGAKYKVRFRILEILSETFGFDY